ncbi:MAG: hypothetical protein LBT86_04880 [Deltaproteobacteria bacterium]|nr:hypothetical protein [Deltaproteobacteria bacterium]
MSLEAILDDLGFDDAVWALGAVPGLADVKRLFACFCARQALATAKTQKPFAQEAIWLTELVDLAEQFARGQLSGDKLQKAEKELNDIINASSPMPKDGYYDFERETIPTASELEADDRLDLRECVLGVLKADVQFAPILTAEKSANWLRDRVGQAIEDNRERFATLLTSKWLKTMEIFKPEALALAREVERALAKPFAVSIDPQRVVDLALEADLNLADRDLKSIFELDEELIDLNLNSNFEMEEDLETYYKDNILTAELRQVFRGEGQYSSAIGS